MEWYGWVAWSLSILTGFAGLILGIRAELRNGYSKNWSIDRQQMALVFYNRTGEDASDVGVLVADGWRVPNYRPYTLTPADAGARFGMVADDRQSPMPFGGVLEWRRSKTGRRYRMRFGDPDISLLVLRAAKR